MQAVQLHTTDTRIDEGSPGQISGAFAVDITNNCPVMVQLTLRVPNGVRIDGGEDIQSTSGGLATTTFVVEPGESRGITADVYAETPGERVVQSSITYFPVDHSEMARQQDTGALTFQVQSERSTSSAFGPGFTPVTLLVALIVATIGLRVRSGR